MGRSGCLTMILIIVGEVADTPYAGRKIWGGKADTQVDKSNDARAAGASPVSGAKSPQPSGALPESPKKVGFCLPRTRPRPRAHEGPLTDHRRVGRILCYGH